jgi:membrane protein implicated in regulation of membrane protease activity
MLWPMLLPAGHFAGMMAAALLMYCERLDPGAVPRWELRGFRTAALSAVWSWRRARQRRAGETPQAA